MTQHKTLTLEEIEAIEQRCADLKFVSPNDIIKLCRMARASLAQAPSDEEIQDRAYLQFPSGDARDLAAFEAGARAFARKPRLSDEELDAAARLYISEQYEASPTLSFKAGYALAWEGEK